MNIRKIRKEKGITQAELASVVGVTPAMISRYESGLVAPPIEKLRRISSFLEAPIDVLLGESAVSNMADSESHTPISQNETTAIAIRHHLAAINMQFSENNHNSSSSEFLCTQDEKLWVIKAVDSFPSGDEDIYPHALFSIIGQMSFIPGINKISIAMSGPFDKLLARLSLFHCPDNFRFDLSVLHVNSEAQMIDRELELLAHYDGTGFYDLTVPGKEAESARKLAAWKSSLSVASEKAASPHS